VSAFPAGRRSSSPCHTQYHTLTSYSGVLRQPLHHQLFRPILRAPWDAAGDEAGVAAGEADSELHGWRGCRLRAAERFQREERIVFRADAERGDRDRM